MSALWIVILSVIGMIGLFVLVGMLSALLTSSKISKEEENIKTTKKD